MKNLILTIAILVTGVINAQSFQHHRDLLANTKGDSVRVDSNLTNKGFIKTGTKDSIIMSYLGINEEAVVYKNDSTDEIVIVTENYVKYAFEGGKYLRVKSYRWDINEENLSYAMTKKIEGGWYDNPLARKRWLDGDRTDDGLSVVLIRKLGKTYVTGSMDVPKGWLEYLLLKR